MSTNAPPIPANVAEKTKNVEASTREVEPLAIGEHHRKNFEQAEAHLAKIYGNSPPADDLMRLWLAGAPPWEITRAFEETVLNISGSDLVPDDEGHYGQSLLNL